MCNLRVARGDSMEDGADRVERVVTLPFTRAEVWAALTEPEQLSSWLGLAIDIELRPGGRVVVTGAAGERRLGLVENVEEPTRLAFRWWPDPRDTATAGVVDPGRTRVEFELDEVGDGTRLRVAESQAGGPRASAERAGLAKAVGAGA